MGDASTALTLADARHLLRRAGFGVNDKDVRRIVGRSRGEVVDDLLDFDPDPFLASGLAAPAGPSIGQIVDSWIRYMVVPKSLRRRPGSTGRNRLRYVRHALQEKLVLFWHDHFATAYLTVAAAGAGFTAAAQAMAAQNALLRRHCLGDWRLFLKEINRDTAMIAFLDTRLNSKFKPNENYARELLELFALGVYDRAGQSNYAQADIVQIARAFTGWQPNYTTFAGNFLGGSGGSSCSLAGSGGHDYAACYPSRGPKVVFQTSGGFGAGGRDVTANGEGAMEIDTVIDILLDHRDSEGASTAARYIADKLFTAFAQPVADPIAVDAIVAAAGFDSQWNLRALLRELFIHDAFYASAAAPAAGTVKSVKWAADFVVGTLRTLRMRPAQPGEYIAGGSQTPIATHLTRMGQQLMEPPSVFGWEWEEAWLTSSTLLARYRFINDVISARVAGLTGFRPRKLVSSRISDPGDIVDAVATALAVADQLSAAERQLLIDYLGPPPINLHDTTVRHTKLNGLFALLLESPLYQLH